MGLDLALGVIILIAAFRGWFQGFVSQAVRIASVIACVYLADQVRDYAKPYVVPYLSTIQPDLVDRLLWWVSAVATYIVLVGVAMLVIKMTRRPEIPGISRSGRNDQFAGFLLGSAKGLLIAAFLAAGILKYGSEPIETVSWAQEQVKASWALLERDVPTGAQDLVGAPGPAFRRPHPADGVAEAGRGIAVACWRGDGGGSPPSAPPAGLPIMNRRARIGLRPHPASPPARTLEPRPLKRKPADPRPKGVANLNRDSKTPANAIELRLTEGRGGGTLRGQIGVRRVLALLEARWEGAHPCLRMLPPTAAACRGGWSIW